MRIHVLLFGVLKDVLGCERDTIDVREGETVDGVLRLFEGRTSNPGQVWRSLAVAVNREYADRSTVLHESDEVALLPPVSGGSGGAKV